MSNCTCVSGWSDYWLDATTGPIRCQLGNFAVVDRLSSRVCSGASAPKRKPRRPSGLVRDIRCVRRASAAGVARRYALGPIRESQPRPIGLRHQAVRRLLERIATAVGMPGKSTSPRHRPPSSNAPGFVYKRPAGAHRERLRSCLSFLQLGPQPYGVMNQKRIAQTIAMQQNAQHWALQFMLPLRQQLRGHGSRARPAVSSDC